MPPASLDVKADFPFVMRLYSSQQCRPDDFVGTGLLISRRHVLTCAHVAEEMPTHVKDAHDQIELVERHQFVTKVDRQEDPEGRVDLAILTLGSSNDSFFDPSHAVRSITALYNVRDFKHEIAADQLHVPGGRYLRAADTTQYAGGTNETDGTGRPFDIQISGGAWEGFSGSPVLTRYGNDWVWVGVAYLGGQGRATTCFIPVDPVRDFLQTHHPQVLADSAVDFLGFTKLSSIIDTCEVQLRTNIINHERSGIERAVSYDPTLRAEDYFSRHYQELPLRRVPVDLRNDPHSPKPPSIPDAEAYDRWERTVFANQPRSDLRSVLSQDSVRVVILGSPGSGKTLFVHYLAYQAIIGGNDNSRFNNSLIPLRVRLREWEEWSFGRIRHGSSIDIGTYLGERLVQMGLAHDSGVARETVITWLRLGKSILLLDGLDELASADPFTLREVPAFRARDFLIYGLRRAAADYPLSPIVMTCRSADFHASGYLRGTCDGFEVWRLSDLSDAGKEFFVRAYPTEHFDAEAMLSSLRETVPLWELAGNPLLLALFCFAADQGSESGPPRTRAELYRRVLSVLFHRPAEEGAFSAVPISKLNERMFTGRLATAAESMLQRGVRQNFESPIFADALAAAGDPNPEETIAFLRRSGLIRLEGARWLRFLHRTFFEYLVGTALVRRPRDESLRMFRKRMIDPAWRQPLRLAIGSLPLEMATRAEVEDWLNEGMSNDATGFLVARFLSECIWEEIADPPLSTIRTLFDRIIIAFGSLVTSASLDNLIRFANTLTKLPSRVRAIWRDALVAALRASLSQAEGAAWLTWFTQSASRDLATALTDRLAEDCSELSWIFDTALREMVCRHPEVLVDAHDSLRYRLRCHPHLATKLTERPDLLRLTLGLYGGLDATIQQRMSEHDALITNLNTELAFWNSRPSRPETSSRIEAATAKLEKLSKDRDDLRKQLTTFNPEYIHREASSVTRVLLNSLENDVPTNLLLADLEQATRSAADFRDASLAIAILSHKNKSSHRSESLYADLARVARYCEPAVIASATSITSGESVARIAPTHSSFDMVAAMVQGVIQLQISRARSPGSIIELLGHVSVERSPTLLAYQWHTMLGMLPGSDDHVYNTAVILDTVGKRIAPDAPVLVSILAQAAFISRTYIPFGSSWKLDRLAFRRGDVAVIALDAIQAIPERLSFVAGWAIGILAPILASRGLRLESEEFVCSAIPDNRYAMKSFALAALSKFEYSEPNAMERFRLQIGRARRDSESISDVDLFSAADAITLPDERFDAFEKLACESDSLRESALNKALIMAEEIGDASTRAFAYLRLACHSSPLLRSEILRNAINATEQIREEKEKADVVAHVREFLVDGKEPTAILRRWASRFWPSHGRAWQRLYDSLPESLRDWISDTSSPLVRNIRQLELAGPTTAPVLLAAIVENASRRDEHSAWSRLVHEDRDIALGGIVNSSPTGITLTLERAVAVDRIASDGDWLILERLLPFLKSAETACIPFLLRWREWSNELCAKLAQLLLAECEGMTSRVSDAIAALLTTKSTQRSAIPDRARLRAMEFVSTLDSQKLSLKGWGTDAAERFMMTALQSWDESQGGSLSAWWVFESTCNDSRAAFNRWIKVARDETSVPTETSSACHLIKHIGYIGDEVWPSYLDALATSPAAVQDLLLYNLSVLLNRGRCSDAQWESIWPICAKLAARPEPLPSCIIDLPNAVLDSLEAARHRFPADQWVTDAATVLPGFATDLRMVFSQSDASLARKTLSSFGAACLWGADLRASLEAASARVAQTPQLLSPLIDWTLVTLQQENTQRQRRIFDYLNSDLILLLAASARLQPALFKRLIIDRGSVDNIIDTLARSAIKGRSFTQRMSSFELLGLIGQFNNSVLNATREGILDVSYVQHAMFWSIKSYSAFNSSVLEPLCQMISDRDSPMAKYIICQLLVRYCSQEAIPIEHREYIRKTLLMSIEMAKPDDHVYLQLRSEGGEFLSLHVGPLVQILQRAIHSVDGIAEGDDNYSGAEAI